MSREILPNVTGPIVVELTVRIGYAIFTISTLSFLGVGIQPPSPDWGLQISEEYSMIINGYLVDGVLPVAGHRQPGDRGQPDRRRPAGGAAAVSALPEQSPQPALEVEDLDVSYIVRGVPRAVLRSVSFTVAPGEAYGLVGESGCGKSTTAYAALRYLPRNGVITGGRALSTEPTSPTCRPASCSGCGRPGCRWSTRIPDQR